MSHTCWQRGAHANLRTVEALLVSLLRTRGIGQTQSFGTGPRLLRSAYGPKSEIPIV